MVIRKIIYNIDYIHILTFKEEYRKVIAPYFTFDKIEYAIDFENTINESLRLVFRNENFILQFRKEGIALTYEGDIAEVKKKNAVVEIFFDIYEKIKHFGGYSKTKKDRIIIYAVDIIEDKEILKKALKKNEYLKNPFPELNDFTCILEFTQNDKEIKFQFGSYSERDIKTHDLSPFKSEFNKDLNGSIGFMCQTNITEETSNPSFTKFKNLIAEGERIINSYYTTKER